MRAFHSEQTIRKKVQKNKDQTCNELQLIFLGSEKQPLFECKCECNFECNCRFSWFSEILSYCQKLLKNKAFPTSIVSYLSFSDASSPVSRTNPETFMASGFFYCAKRLRKQNLQTSRSFRIDLPRGIIYNWIAYHLRCNRRHVAHHPIDKGGFIP